MKAVIDECRTQLGPAPRRFSIVRWSEWQLHPPAWSTTPGREEFQEIYEHQRVLREEGAVVWASVVQANAALLRHGFDNSPAYCVYSPDPWFDDNVPVLRHIGRNVFGLKAKVLADLALEDVARTLSDTRAPYHHSRLPTAFAERREVFCTTLVVHRKHLPQGILRFGYFPVLVQPDRTRAAMILPSHYWPGDLQTMWKTGSTGDLRAEVQSRVPTQ